MSQPQDPSSPSPVLPRSDARVVAVALVLLALSAIAIFAAGLSLGGQIAGRDAEERAAVEAFVETYRRINDEYVGESEPGELIEGAIEGMFETLDDPYSAYLSAEEFESTFAEVSGHFEGVGARMDMQAADGSSCPRIDAGCRLRVVEVLPGTPALAAGLQVDDIVTAVDGHLLQGQAIEDAVRLIRGPRDSRVTLSLDRDGQGLDLAITRGLIASQDVRPAVLAEGQIGYLRIDGFSSLAAESFERSLGELLDTGIARFIVDLRGDPGGFVDQAVEITSQFIAAGPVYWEEDADGNQRSIAARAGGLAVDPAIELVVLVDAGSASASEIVAGALQDAGRAELVGEPTFGKGTVQEWTRLPSQGSGFRLSTARWLTRDKRWLHGVGLRPDVEVATTGERFQPGNGSPGVEAERVAADAQLQRAIELLLGAPGHDPAATWPP